ncbi:NRG1 [Cyberlindnera jadinii]|uniref:NRG1 protein n=2 Tax=Cyberlindnera jadinii (strain ATCC 18201 / CBS 1600 / BCRC 20928 / JCM 3617 / NBRC 0987 / NRRL Y-1542) TaxID=983966 RepID=A0A0H5BY73_CYBJN|nr:NRG1 [Cyberlindnera jadinii]
MTQVTMSLPPISSLLAETPAHPHPFQYTYQQAHPQLQHLQVYQQYPPPQRYPYPRGYPQAQGQGQIQEQPLFLIPQMTTPMATTTPTPRPLSPLYTPQTVLPSLSQALNTTANQTAPVKTFILGQRPGTASSSTPTGATSTSKPASSPVHVDLSESKSVRKYRCKICEKCFTTSGHLARHSRIHTGERKHVCPFEGCGAKFARQDNCMQHFRTHQNPKTRRKRIRRNV